MPTLVLKPFMEMVITSKQEKAILQFMQSDEPAITVNKTTITKGAIAYIKPGGVTEPDLRPQIEPSRRLKADNRTDEQRHTAARKASDVARAKLKKMGVLKNV